MNVVGESQRLQSCDSINMLQDVDTGEETECVNKKHQQLLVLCSMQIRRNGRLRKPQKVQMFHSGKHAVSKRAFVKFGEEGMKLAMSNHRGCIDQDSFLIMEEQKRMTMESFLFMVEKNNGRIKLRTVDNGSQQRLFVDEDSAASQTASMEATLIPATMDAMKESDAATVDMPNAFK